MDNNNTFEILNAINVNGMTEKKKQTNGTTLTYISWASAYQIAKQHFPDLSYEVERNPETGLPYWYDPLTGYMVFTKVTINGVTHEMWLPVLDATNHAMKSEPYQVKTKYKTLTIQKASMADINRSIMRCLTKCLGMHGLGLYLYQGEDLPSVEQAQPAQQPVKPIEKAAPQAPAQQKPVKDTRPVTPQMVDFIKKTLEEHQVPTHYICQKYKVSELNNLKVNQAKHIVVNINRLKQMFDSEKRERLANVVQNTQPADKKQPQDKKTTFGDYVRHQQPPKQETEGEEITLDLSPSEMEALAECANIFS